MLQFLLISGYVPWDEGSKHMYGWWMLIGLLIVGVIFNVSQLIAHFYIPELRKQQICVIIVWLSFIDLLFDLACLVQCILNTYAEEFYGRELACNAQTVWAEFLMMMSGLLICSIMYSSYSAIIHGHYLTKYEINKMVFIFAIYCMFLTILGSIYPGRGSLNSSGIFCYTNYYHLSEGITFHIGYVFPLLGTLCYYFYKLYRGVRNMTLILSRAGYRVGPKPKEVIMAKRMSLYIFALLICLLPFEIAAIFSWSTNNIPYVIWIIASISGHILTLISPVLYMLLNKYAREIIWNAILHTLNFSRNIIVQTINHDYQDIITNNELVQLLNERQLYNRLLEYATSRLNPEPLLFWHETQQWIYNTSKLMQSIKCNRCLETICDKCIKIKHDSKASGETYDKNTCDQLISDSAQHIYVTYIAQNAKDDGYVANLLINISHDLRVYTKKLLKLNAQYKCNLDASIFTVIHVFDECRNEMLNLIKQDLLTNMKDPDVKSILETVLIRRKMIYLNSGNALTFVSIEVTPEVTPNTKHENKYDPEIELSFISTERTSSNTPEKKQYNKNENKCVPEIELSDIVLYSPTNNIPSPSDYSDDILHSPTNIPSPSYYFGDILYSSNNTSPHDDIDSLFYVE
jgi:hypothetical protein